MSSSTPAVGRVEIVSATYGGADVTAKVQNLCDSFYASNPSGTFSFQAWNGTFGDPNVGIQKVCTTLYRRFMKDPHSAATNWSQIGSTATREGGTITLNFDNLSIAPVDAAPPKDAQWIVGAYYFDKLVTDDVRAIFAANKRPGQATSLTINPSNVGGDPAQGTLKNISITYATWNSPGQWQYKLLIGMDGATLNIPSALTLTTPLNYVTFQNNGQEIAGTDLYPCLWSNTGDLIWDGQQHGFILRPGMSRDLALFDRAGISGGQSCYLGFAYVKGNVITDHVYDTTFLASVVPTNQITPYTFSWNGVNSNPVVSHKAQQRRNLDYGAKDLRLIIRGASWGSHNCTQFMTEKYITSTVLNPPTSTGNQWSFTADMNSLGRLPDDYGAPSFSPVVPNNRRPAPTTSSPPYWQKMLVIIYQIGYKVDEQRGYIINPAYPNADRPFENAPELMTPQYPVIDDIGSQFFVATAKAGATININLLSLSTTPSPAKPISLSGGQSKDPEVLCAVWSNVDVTNAVHSWVNSSRRNTQQTANFAEIAVAPSTLNNGVEPWPYVPKNFTAVYRYASSNAQYTYCNKVLAGPLSTWFFSIERTPPAPQPDMRPDIISAYRLLYDSELMSNYVVGGSSSAKIQTYTIDIQAVARGQVAIPSATILIQASVNCQVLLNSVPVNLSLVPYRYSFDALGEMCLVVQVQGLTTPSFSFSRLQDAAGNKLTAPMVVTTIDPSQKTAAWFGKVSKGGDLKTVPGRNGKSMMQSGTSISDGDLNTVAKSLNDLQNAMPNMAGTPPAVYQGLTDMDHGVVEIDFRSQAKQADSTSDFVNWWQNLPSTLSHVGDEALQGIQGTWQTVEGKGQFLIKEAGDTAGWILDQTKTVVSYVVEFAKETYTFVVNTATDICIALDKLWSLLKLGWEDLVDFVGWLFEWQDIINTQRTIENLFTASLSYWSSELQHNQFTMNGSLQTLGQQKSQGTAVLPPQTVDPSGSSTSSQNSISGQAMKNNPTLRWVTAHLKQGSFTFSQPMQPGATDSTPTDSSIVSQLKPIMDQMSSTITDFTQKISQMVDPSSLVSVGDLIQSLATDVLDAIVDAVSTFIRKVIGLLGMILQRVNDLGNAKINVPVLSDLYRELVGEDLTLFSVTSLLIAIPASIITKAITNNSVPTVPSNQDNVTAMNAAVASSNDTTTKAETDKAKTQTFVVTNLDILEGAVLSSAALTSMCIALGDLIGQNIETGQRPDRKIGKTVGTLIGRLIALVGAAFTMPRDKTLPAYPVRVASSSIRCLVYLINVICEALDSGTIDDTAYKTRKIATACEGTIHFSLGCAISAAELDQSQYWAEYNPELSALQVSSNVCSFTAMVLDTVAFGANQAGFYKAAQIALTGAFGFQTGNVASVLFKTEQAFVHQYPVHLW